MDYQKELNELFNQMQDKLANGISTILRSIKDKDKRIIALKKWKNNHQLIYLKEFIK